MHAQSVAAEVIAALDVDVEALGGRRDIVMPTLDKVTCCLGCCFDLIIFCTVAQPASSLATSHWHARYMGAVELAAPHASRTVTARRGIWQVLQPQPAGAQKSTAQRATRHTDSSLLHTWQVRALLEGDAKKDNENTTSLRTIGRSELFS